MSALIRLQAGLIGSKSGGQTRILVSLLDIILTLVEILEVCNVPLLSVHISLIATIYNLAVPLITQSDPGSENFSVANAQTMMCHRLDPNLNGTLQHRWMEKHQNIKPEILWSVLCKDLAPGFENILEEGVVKGLYDIHNTLQKYITWCFLHPQMLINNLPFSYIFRWLAIPWLQAELDAWVHFRNYNPPRRDKHKILPHGIPAIICAKPHKFDSLDFKVPIPGDLIDEVEGIYTPPDHPVFELVPPIFGRHAQDLYGSLGKPRVSSESFWDVYQLMRQQFEALEGDRDLTVELSQSAVHLEDGQVLLIPDLQDLPHNTGLLGPAGYLYMGGMFDPPTRALHGVCDWEPQGCGYEQSRDER
ncbi:hypothetical protein DFJ58DRAFT_733787 [Suillus subalutaceus]|uniref:uncharacterized protein n=1 Tax=Suillus subalutaceus TaxID=48586 RepID=UPI001B87D804|nr:uncharacterized protein DFJ58DRAFT_733787 [Suillus subalutaceus]KAG1838531.1 hypothetical protein DFJ58DRAFT_733787 [Suillus subalutaceus]